jgi:hypothetical protein
MLSENSHLSDQELLLAADGELPTRRATQVNAHLAACWNCRARMAGIEAAIANFARAHHQILDPQLPPIEGPRAQLRTQIAQLASHSSVSPRRWFFQFTSLTSSAAFICVAFLMTAAFGSFIFQHSDQRYTNSIVALVERGAVPDHSLTPGATRSVTITEVCSLPHEKVVADVSASLRQKVFQEYGIMNAREGEYEVDYLITPGLGGAEDIHNLWPESYRSQTWNANVKDDLEERLHQLVCAGALDLSTAQRDIATDWIAAYKKYFHTNRPLTAFMPGLSDPSGNL